LLFLGYASVKTAKPKLRLNLVLAVTSSLLAACSSTEYGSKIIDNREFTVRRDTATNLAVGPDKQLGELLSNTSQSYVSLVTTEVEKLDQTYRQLGNRSAGKRLASGSGYVVERAGYVVTAAHVALEKGNVVSARAANGRVYSGSVVDVLPTNDIALIRLRGYSGIAVTPAANACLASGEFV